MFSSFLHLTEFVPPNEPNYSTALREILARLPLVAAFPRWKTVAVKMSCAYVYEICNRTYTLPLESDRWGKSFEKSTTRLFLFYRVMCDVALRLSRVKARPTRHCSNPQIHLRRAIHPISIRESGKFETSVMEITHRSSCLGYFKFNSPTSIFSLFSLDFSISVISKSHERNSYITASRLYNSFAVCSVLPANYSVLKEQLKLSVISYTLWKYR